MHNPLVGGIVAVLAVSTCVTAQIVQDAEYYILEAQNGERWSAEDTQLQARLAALRERFGRPPNIVHIMWDDTAYGDIGIPAIQKVRGLETPQLNRMASEGILFSRMYTEVGCTPSRAACATGRLAVRSGMYNIGMLGESHGMRAEEVTIAEVLGEVGYATAFHGKWHLGDIEQSRTRTTRASMKRFFTAVQPGRQSSGTPAGPRVLNAAPGLFEPMLRKDNPYKLDDRRSAPRPAWRRLRPR